MPTFTMQKQSARNLVLSPNIQAAWGTQIIDAKLTSRQRFNPSSVFTHEASRRSDQNAFSGLYFFRVILKASRTVPIGPGTGKRALRS